MSSPSVVHQLSVIVLRQSLLITFCGLYELLAHSLSSMASYFSIQSTVIFRIYCSAQSRNTKDSVSLIFASRVPALLPSLPLFCKIFSVSNCHSLSYFVGISAVPSQTQFIGRHSLGRNQHSAPLLILT